MKHDDHIKTPPSTRWPHFNLFQKCALVFFFIVALPLLLIAFYVMEQTQSSILGITESFIDAATTCLDDMSVSHQQKSNVLLDDVSQEFLRVNTASLMNLKRLMVEEHVTLYTQHVQSVVKTLQAILETEFHATLPAARISSLDALVAEHVTQIEQQMEERVQQGVAAANQEALASFERQTQAALDAIRRDDAVQAETSRQWISERLARIARNVQQKTFWKILPVICVVGLLAMMLGMLVARAMIRPIKDITAVARALSQGDLNQTVPVINTRDEIGMLSRSFDEIIEYWRNISRSAQQIAEGEFHDDVAPLSEHDALGQAFQNMTRYLREIAALVGEISRGDVTQMVTAKSDADVLGNAVSRMTLYLQRITRTAKKVAGGNLSDDVQPQSDKDFLGKAFADMILKLRHLVSKIRAGSDQLVTLSMDTHSRALQEAESVEKISLSVEETSSSMNQMASTISEVNERMKQLSSFVGESSSSIDVIRLLNARTESIETILDVIKDMSDQTSLLSINASIIAKKAGERGRGFNVIADKVRRLADQSNSSAKEIARILRDVRKESSHAVDMVSTGIENVREGVKLAKVAGKALDKIITGANESSSVISKIAETTGEQTKISQYIMESMDQVVEMINQIKVATREQELSSSYIMTQAEHLLLLSQQVKQATTEQTEVVRHVSVTMDDIRALIEMTSKRAAASTQSALLLSHHADALKHLVSQFMI